MMAPGLPDVALTYHITSPTVVALTLTAFLISFAVGVRFTNLITIIFFCLKFIHVQPLIMAPLSEIHGRSWVGKLYNLAANSYLNFILHKGPSYRQYFHVGFQPRMCILPNDRLTNRISVSLFVNCTLHTGLPSLTYMHQLGFREVLPLP